MKNGFYFLGLCICLCLWASCSSMEEVRDYNEKYTGEYTSRIAFPIGGLGTGMFCVEGSGAISNMNIRHKTEMLNEPTMFAGLYLKGVDNGSIVVEGQVPDWKKFGQPQSTKGYGGTWGLPRFKDCDFEVKFPFAKLRMSDDELKMDVTMKVWNPFIPTDENNSGLPVAGFEYTFKNKYAKEVEAIFSYNSKNFVDIRNGGASIRPIENGFIISQKGTETQPFHQADFAIFTDEPETKVNYCWFRGWVVSPYGKSNWVFPLYLIWIESCFWMPYKSLTSLAKSITLELWYLLMRLMVVVIISKRVSWYSVCEKSWDSSLYLVEH